MSRFLRLTAPASLTVRSSSSPSASSFLLFNPLHSALPFSRLASTLRQPCKQFINNYNNNNSTDSLYNSSNSGMADLQQQQQPWQSTLPGFLRPEQNTTNPSYQNKAFDKLEREERRRFEEGRNNVNSPFSIVHATQRANRNLNRCTFCIVASFSPPNTGINCVLYCFMRLRTRPHRRQQR